MPAFQTYLVSVFAVTPDMEKTGEPLQESLDRVKVATSLWDPEEVASHAQTAAATLPMHMQAL